MNLKQQFFIYKASSYIQRVCQVIWDKNKTAIKILREAKSQANFFSDVVCFVYNTLVENFQ